MRKAALLTLGLLTIPLAAHATCRDDVDTLAQRYHVDAALPSASTPMGAINDKLAASGGVIAPPATGDMAAATPAVPGGDRMQTAPALPPQTAEGGTVTAAPDSQAHAAASTAQASALLQAARDAAKNGNESACEQRLADARTLLGKTAGTSE